MPKIIQLDRHVADLIAAGEVVERPASAVKELVENSIDAGAKNITIELQNGGMTFLRITDDGCGMDPVDARTAFLRHATSKIRRQEDLACIGTLGFRGEALAAISSVSKIDLLTRAQGAEAGELEIGYWVGKPFWGRGIAPEAVEALLAHCFTELGAERVWCAYFDGNEKSRRCQEKCGFRFHHTERDVHWAATDEIKTEHYSILTRAEWLARQKPED